MTNLIKKLWCYSLFSNFLKQSFVGTRQIYVSVTFQHHHHHQTEVITLPTASSIINIHLLVYYLVNCQIRPFWFVSILSFAFSELCSREFFYWRMATMNLRRSIWQKRKSFSVIYLYILEPKNVSYITHKAMK